MGIFFIILLFFSDLAYILVKFCKEFLMKNIRNVILPGLIVLIGLLPNSLKAQYFRDQTRLLLSNSLYPSAAKDYFSHYNQDEIIPITLHEEFKIPEINVKFGDDVIPLFFDFGNNGNILITNAVSENLTFIVEDTVPTYTPDGKVRAIVYDIVLQQFELLDSVFINEPAILADWSVFSTSPTNGIVGLKYFQNKRFTLSYRDGILAITDDTIQENYFTERASMLPIQVFENHPYGVYFEGKVNGQRVLIYFDTGKSHSKLNQNLFQDSKIVSDKSGSFYADTVSIHFGNHHFEMYYPRVGGINRSTDSSDLLVGMEVGSDILNQFLITIDRTNGKNHLILH